MLAAETVCNNQLRHGFELEAELIEGVAFVAAAAAVLAPQIVKGIEAVFHPRSSPGA